MPVRDEDSAAALSELPSVDHLLRQPAIANLLDEYARSELLAAIRQTLDEQRGRLRVGQAAETATAGLALAVRQKLHQRSRPNLRPVINATGVVLHTGLGRAPLAQEAIDAITEVAAGYCNLELDLETGRRGDRHDNVRGLLRELTGAEDAIVVNNNAAATLLALNTLARDREVIISRGQLVEIGGSYRMPDVMAASGCRMIEVGTTNRTHLADYERAITADTAAIIRVHTSNYRIEGFVASPSLAELVALARSRVERPLVIDDLGSGLLDAGVPSPSGVPCPRLARRHDTTRGTDNELGEGLSSTGGRGHAPSEPDALDIDWDEPAVPDSVAAGSDLTLFSGDKLLGGPQAGIIIGRTELIASLRANALTRTYRPDKLTLAGLEATLRLYRDPDSLHRRLPVRRMLCTPLPDLRALAELLATDLAARVPELSVRCEQDESCAGGGALPTIPFPTWVASVRHPELSAGELSAALRRRDVPILCRVRSEAILFDARTLREDDVEQIAGAVADVVREMAESE